MYLYFSSIYILNYYKFTFKSLNIPVTNDKQIITIYC